MKEGGYRTKTDSMTSKEEPFRLWNNHNTAEKQLHDLLIFPSAFDNSLWEMESNLSEAKATTDSHQTIA